MLQLPTKIRIAAESIFNTDFKNVCIHLSSKPKKLEPKAYAYGNNIYLEHGAYNPDTPEGQRILGHELAHIVQQRQNRHIKSTGTCLQLEGGITILHDCKLEDEADDAGECLVASIQGLPFNLPKNLQLTSRLPTGIKQPRVQCLMTVEVFQNLTKARGKRNKIVDVETSLAAYHAAVKAKPSNIGTCCNALNDVYVACKTYQAERPNSGRASGINRLIRQIGFEQTVFAMLNKAATSGDAGAQWQAISTAKENYIKIQSKPEMADSQKHVLEMMVGNSIGAFKMLDETKTISQAMMESDMAALRTIGGYSSTPAALRTVIDSCLAVKSRVNLSYGSMRSASMTQHSDGSYTLNHNADQGMGSKERLGSLLHELTHLLIGETFNNTPMLIDASTTATDNQLIAISAQRTAFLHDLQESLESNAKLFNYMRSDSLPANQGGVLHGMLKHKAKYPLAGGKYVDAFHRKGKIDDATHTRWTALSTNHSIKLQLIEFTPCINQMLLWCHLFDWDPTDKIYTMLLGQCQNEIVRRRVG